MITGQRLVFGPVRLPVAQGRLLVKLRAGAGSCDNRWLPGARHATALPFVFAGSIFPRRTAPGGRRIEPAGLGSEASMARELLARVKQLQERLSEMWDRL